MIDDLYSAKLLRLAAEMPRAGRLADPHASSEKVSKLCGSRIIVDVKVAGGRVTDFAQDVKACALGQASAALMAANACGRSVEELDSARDALAAYLADTRGDPGAWPGLAIFAPAVPHRARHASILLAFDAVAQAAREALH